MTFRAAMSCSLQPGGRLAPGAADGPADAGADATADAVAAADGAVLGSVVAAAGVAGAPKLHWGAPEAVHAATVAATPVRPATPTTRRKPRRLSGPAPIAPVSRASDSGGGPEVGVGARKGSTVTDT